MTVLRYLAPFLAYSFGAVALRPRRAGPQVAPAELAVLCGVLAAAFFVYRTWHSFAAVLAIAGVALVAGAVTTGVAGRRWQTLPAGTREFELREATGTRQGVWKRYLAFSRRVADFEVRLVLVAAYLLLLAPISVVARFAQKPEEPSDSTWRHRGGADTLDSARRPF